MERHSILTRLTSRKSISWCLALVYLVVGWDFASADEVEVIPVPTEMCRGYFFVPITLSEKKDYPEDRTLWFLFDTGASSSFADPDSIERVSGQSIKAGKKVNIRDASAGAVEFRRLPVRMQQLDHLSMALGREIDGILGFTAFKKFLLTLDYVQGEMRLERGNLPPADDLTVFDASGRDKRPWMDVRFPTSTRRMLLDSGAALSDLSVRNLDSFATTTGPRPVGASMRLKKVERRSAARSSGDVVIGGHSLVMPTMQSSQGTELIGGEVMRHFTWTFDQRNKTVRMIRNEPATPISFEPVIAHGMVFRPIEQGFEVHELIEGLPASVGGVLRGDIITHIGGFPLKDRQCKAPANDVMKLGLLRGGQPMELNIKLFAAIE